MAKEVCSVCKKEIKDNPVPLYQKKRHSEDDPKMWRHEECPSK